MAESFKDWLHDGVYPDLVSFEKDLAAISCLSIVILESEGALAELGAFTQLEELQHKLFIVVPQQYFESQSFIDLGIFRFITKQAGECIYYYDWNEKRPGGIADVVLQELAADLDEVVSSSIREQTLRRKSHAHQMILLSALVEVFIAIQKHEIAGYFSELGFEVASPELDRMLFCLEKLDVIRKRVQGNWIFYLKGSRKFHEVRFRYEKENQRFKDHIEATLAVHEFYSNARSERRRKAVIQKFMSGEGANVL